MHALLASSATRSAPFRRSTSSARTASRPRRGGRAAFLAREGLSVGAYTSPHVSGWSERIQVDGEDADLEQALERVREPAERLGATQFEVLTAAAFAEFAVARVDVAVVEAGLGGRLDATNVLDARVVALTNVGARPHRCPRRDPRADRGREARRALDPARSSSPASRSGAASMPTTWAGPLPRPSSDASWKGTSRSRSLGGSTSSARTSSPERTTRPASSGSLPRLPRATTSSSRRSSRTRTRRRCCASSAAPAARSSPPPRPAPAHSTRKSSRGSPAPFFDVVEAVTDPEEALARARDLAGPDGAVLVTGSLYLLADLSVRPNRIPWESSARG